MNCGVGCRHDLDPALLWLWRRPVATVPITLLAWEPPYAMRAALKRKKTNKKTPRVGNSALRAQSVDAGAEGSSILGGWAEWVMGSQENRDTPPTNVAVQHGDLLQTWVQPSIRAAPSQVGQQETMACGKQLPAKLSHLQGLTALCHGRPCPLP